MFYRGLNNIEKIIFKISNNNYNNKNSFYVVKQKTNNNQTYKKLNRFFNLQNFIKFNFSTEDIKNLPKIDLP